MTGSHGKHVYVDYIGYRRNGVHDGHWMLKQIIDAANTAGVRIVHSHVEEFDGSISPTGFASIVLLDESHISAHCYYEKGWLAIDAFTCGGSNPEVVADLLDKVLRDEMADLVQMRREIVERFLHDDVEGAI
tara:strand:+ start:1886 stop:2281 length:396 start_codon:yes stop_codon:yes gene_type:complete